MYIKNNKITEFFNILNLKPKEWFNIEGFHRDKIYMIDSHLDVWVKDAAFPENVHPANITIDRFLIGTHKIVKLPPQLSQREMIAIEYLKTCGCKYVVKQQSGEVCGFTCEPYFETLYDEWTVPNNVKMYSPKFKFECGIDISFIHWDDNKPYYIGD